MIVLTSVWPSRSCTAPMPAPDYHICHNRGYCHLRAWTYQGFRDPPLPTNTGQHNSGRAAGDRAPRSGRGAYLGHHYWPPVSVTRGAENTDIAITIRAGLGKLAFRYHKLPQDLIPASISPRTDSCTVSHPHPHPDFVHRIGLGKIWPLRSLSSGHNNAWLHI